MGSNKLKRKVCLFASGSDPGPISLTIVSFQAIPKRGAADSRGNFRFRITNTSTAVTSTTLKYNICITRNHCLNETEEGRTPAGRKKKKKKKKKKCLPRTGVTKGLF